MKVLFYLSMIFFVNSCSTKPNQLPTSALVKDYVKSQMKDPSSFHLIRIRVADTTMMNKFLQDKYNEDTAMISKIPRSDEIITKSHDSVQENYPLLLDKKVAVYREAATKDSIEIAQHNPDRIFYISYVVDYRAKNGFGALDKGVALVNYYPADTTFKMITP